MPSFWSCLGLLCCLCLLGGTTANAFELSPLVHELSTSGRQSTAKMWVRNPSDQTIPLELSVQRISFGPRGQPTLAADEKEELLVFPPALLLKPGSQQVIRMQWSGPPTIGAARSYLVTLAQLPLATPQQTGVQLLISFNALVHVADQHAHATLQIAALRLLPQSPTLIATIRNSGQRHAYLSDYSLEIRHLDKIVEQLTGDILRTRGEDLLLPPGVVREATISLQTRPNTDELSLVLTPNQKVVW